MICFIDLSNGCQCLVISVNCFIIVDLAYCTDCISTRTYRRRHSGTQTTNNPDVQVAPGSRPLCRLLARIHHGAQSVMGASAIWTLNDCERMWAHYQREVCLCDGAIIRTRQIKLETFNTKIYPRPASDEKKRIQFIWKNFTSTKMGVNKGFHFANISDFGRVDGAKIGRRATIEVTVYLRTYEAIFLFCSESPSPAPLRDLQGERGRLEGRRFLRGRRLLGGRRLLERCCLG